MKFRAVRVRVTTPKAIYGADGSFKSGLNVIRADNTSGKSTLVQSLIWALGLEGMYGPSKVSPLTPAVLTELSDPDTGELVPVLESSATIEIESATGDVLTVRRAIASKSQSTDLVQTWRGPELSESRSTSAQADFYVRTTGAARNPSGFHNFLAQFLGWQLPTVLRSDGLESLLYLESLFPVSVVEQKRGWSGLFALMPWHLRIPDMATRAIEYVLSLDVLEVSQRRRRLIAERDLLHRQWRELVATFRDRVTAQAGVLQGIPLQASPSWPQEVQPRILISGPNQAVLLPTLLSLLRTELSELSRGQVPRVGDIVEEATEQLVTAEGRLKEVAALVADTLDEVALAEEQVRALDARQRALGQDLQRYTDLRRLRDIGSTLQTTLTPSECPTCHQPLRDVLLTPEELPTVLDAASNETLIREQIRTFDLMRTDFDRQVDAARQRLSAARHESNDLRSAVRALRRTLTADERQPAESVIERRLRLADHIERLESLELDFGALNEELGHLAHDLLRIESELQALGRDTLSDPDEHRVDGLERLFKQQLSQYGFRSYPLDHVGISNVRLTPTHDDVDLSYGLSASDQIRSIWAYLIGLLEEAASGPANHPGFVIFDEPRQQDADPVSFQALLARAGNSASRNQQVIFATSEEPARLIAALAGIPSNYLAYEGRILRKV